VIDLHTHSRASDGLLQPAELAAAAGRAGLTAVALTDHDTTAGLPEFLEAARGLAVEAVPGVEFSCSWYAGVMHVVGLFINPGAPELEFLLKRIRASRDDRNRRIVARLQELGADITWDGAAAQAGGAVMGRPHIARELVARGICPNTQEAFRRFLAVGQPAYIRRYLPLPEEIIAIVHRAGGVTVWAHPLSKVRESPSHLRQTARFLKERGLDAIEARYSEFNADDTAIAERVAGQVKLLTSGGSDFHGDPAAGIALGTGHGDLAVPDAWLEPLRARAAVHAQTHGAK